MWNVEKCVYGSTSPVILKGEHRSNIFCAVFDNDNSHIFSAGEIISCIYFIDTLKLWTHQLLVQRLKDFLSM